MIREERDPAFWDRVAQHPEVGPHVFLGGAFPLAEIVSNPRVLPLAAEHGGMLFASLDGIGRVYELHTLFTPEGWGREVAAALKEATEHLFTGGAQILVTLEVEGHWRSQPPKSHGWKPAGPFAPTPLSDTPMRSWSLTMIDWLASPVRRRMLSCPS